MKYLLVVLAIMILGVHANPQLLVSFPEEPEVGKPCPPFTLNKIDFYSKKKASLDDFKGKWLVLDFWAKNCSSCISKFPRINEEQKEFRDSVQFLMITYEDKENEHRRMYANYHKNLHLEMPGAIDSNIFNNFNVGLLPHTIVIDPNGIVRAVTVNVTANKLKDLMAGKKPWFSPASYAREKEKKDLIKFDPKLPFEVGGNGGKDGSFIFRSLLSQWLPGNPRRYDKGMIHDAFEYSHYLNQGRFEMLGMPLANLYLAAYTGRPWVGEGQPVGDFWPKPLLEVNDTAAFIGDPGSGKNLYCYSLIVPPVKATEKYMMNIMQADLQHYFGYSVRVEIRNMPYWRVIVIDPGKIKMNSRDSGDFKLIAKGPWEGGTYRNIPFNSFVEFIKMYFGLSASQDPPVIDETGINGNVDITVEWFKNDYTSIRKALRKNGLDLIEGKKEMKVLVIRDEK